MTVREVVGPIEDAEVKDLDERKQRFLMSAQCRELWEQALQPAEASGHHVEHLRSAALEALNAADRFADTGKTKAALKAAKKRLDSLEFDPKVADISQARFLTISLVSQPAEMWGQVLASTRNILALQKLVLPNLVMPNIKPWTKDLTPPVNATLDLDRISEDVIELAEEIYRDCQFERMPELANALETSDFPSKAAIQHCRDPKARHIRGCWVLDGLLGERIRKEKKSAAKSPSTPKPRHKILGRELHDTLDYTRQSLVNAHDKYAKRTAPGQPSQQFSRELYLDSCLACAIAEHLGFGPIDHLESSLQRGTDAAVDYFYGDWFAADDEDAKALDKSRGDRELRWAGPFITGLLLCGLTSRWGDAVRLAEWIDESIQLEHRFELNDYEYQWLYLCLASELRSEPLANASLMLEQLKACKPRRPRMLAAAWSALLAEDQASFDKSIKQSLTAFFKTSESDAPNFCYWIAVDESLLCMLAERRGLQIPKLPPKSDAALVRRQTIGLNM